MARVAELKRVLGKAKIDSVFSTNFNRTRNTAKPLADFRELPVNLYLNETEVIARILNNSRGKRLLVVGHSNTVANFIQACDCTPPADINPIPDAQFDNMYLVLVQPVVVNDPATSKCGFIQMKYGVLTS